MFGKLVTRSGPKSTQKVLPAARLLAGASAFALTAAIGVSFTMTMSTPAVAYICDAGTTGTDASDSALKFNTACGQAAVADGGAAFGATAYGNSADALATASVAVGSFATVDLGSDGGIAVGRNAQVETGSSDRGIAIGDNARVGNASFVGGANVDDIAIGTTARANGVATIAIGLNAVSNNDGSIALGANSGGFNSGTTELMGGHAVSIGIRSRATGGDGVSIGHRAKAQRFRATAVGADASVEAGSGTALGALATVAAGHSNSTAVGAGATTSRANQIVLGTVAETYTLRGLTTPGSKSEQSGPLELVTTDEAGNLASGGGSIFEDIEENTEGVAMAMALENPDLKGSENFGIAINGGFFEGESAIAGAIMATLTDDLLSQLGAGSGGRLALAGGAAYGVDHNNFGGRVGLQLTW